MNPLIDEFERRRIKAESEFHNQLINFMQKYGIPINQLNRIGVISWIDSIEQSRDEMIKWNNRVREEKELEK